MHHALEAIGAIAVACVIVGAIVMWIVGHMGPGDVP